MQKAGKAFALIMAQKFVPKINDESRSLLIFALYTEMLPLYGLKLLIETALKYLCCFLQSPYIFYSIAAQILQGDQNLEVNEEFSKNRVIFWTLWTIQYSLIFELYRKWKMQI